MSHARLSVLSVMLLVALPLQAYAQEAAPTQAQENASTQSAVADIAPDPALVKMDEPYQRALKSLTPAQQAQLQKLEQEYFAADTSSVESTKSLAQFTICAEEDAATAKDKLKYASMFGVYDNRLQAAALPARLAHEKRLATEASFIDQNLLAEHYDYARALMTETSVKVLQQSHSLKNQIGESKDMAKDCADLREKLEKTFTEAARPATEAENAQNKKWMDDLQKKAEGGDNEALTALGTAQLIGTYGAQDTAKGIATLTRAAEAGYAPAQLMLGMQYTKALAGDKPDMDKAKHWLSKAVEQGDVQAAGLLKMVQENTIPQDRPLNDVRLDALNGDPTAQYELASRYALGAAGAKKDPAMALQWLLMAAGFGNPYAQSDAGVQLFNQGRTSEGVLWTMQAAQQGVPAAQYRLGNFYAGEQVANLPRARYWYQLAANAGDARAKEALAAMAGQ